MKFLSVFAILCLALYCNQVNSVALYKTEAERAKELLGFLKRVIRIDVPLAVNRFMALIDTIEENAVLAEKVATEQLQNAAKSFNKQIDTLVAEAKENGLDVADCVDSSQEEISDLPAQILDDVRSCLGVRVAEVINEVFDEIRTINDTLKEIPILEDEVYSCAEKGFVGEVKCYRKVTIQIDWYTFYFLSEVFQNLVEATVYVESVKSELPQCGVTSTATLAMDAEKIVNDVRVCIAEKANASTTASPPTNP